MTVEAPDNVKQINQQKKMIELLFLLALCKRMGHRICHYNGSDPSVAKRCVRSCGWMDMLSTSLNNGTIHQDRKGMHPQMVFLKSKLTGFGVAYADLHTMFTIIVGKIVSTSCVITAFSRPVANRGSGTCLTSLLQEYGVDLVNRFRHVISAKADVKTKALPTSPN